MRRKNVNNSTISFDEEVVPKDVADKILASEKINVLSKEIEESNNEKNCRRKRKGTLELEQASANGDKKTKKEKQALKPQELNEEKEKKDKKKKKQKRVEGVPELNENEQTEKKEKKIKKKQLQDETSNKNEEQTEEGESKKTESIRAMKRKRYAKLLEEKRIKAEVALQQKALNYLSNWKHNREEWKFEKLRQIWLKHNMYDTAKIPEEFWDVLVEYLGNSKGKARNVIIDEAVKLIENCSEDEENEIKIKRARDIIQNLQE